MKHISRILTALLALLMILPSAIACADPVDPETTTGGEGAQTTVPAPDATTPVEDTIFAPSDIPEDLKFTGTAVKFLYWSDVERDEFFVEEEDADLDSVKNAIFTRNARVEEQFEVELEFTGTPGNYSNQNSFVNTCINSTQSGADAHDIFCGYSMTGATLMTQGIAQDMTQYDIMEFDKPWWPSTLIEKATIHDGIYFASGDISTMYLYMMYGCFFNKEMFIDINGPVSTLYDLVYDKQWTLDKLIEFSTGVFSEQNSDNIPSEGDRFGFVTTNIHFDAFYTAADLCTVTTGGDGDLILSGDLASQKTIDLLTKVCSFLYDTGDCWTQNSNTIFSQEQALFTIDRVYLASGKLKESDFDFGILPVPKYTAEQEDYRTCMAFPFTNYVLSTASPNASAAAATLELMAYQSYLLITPALFEESMKVRYADAGDDSLMYDIIRENVVIDLGRLMTTQVDNMSYNIFRNAVSNNGVGSWSAALKTQLKLFERKINNINKAIEKLQ